MCQQIEQKQTNKKAISKDLEQNLMMEELQRSS